MLAWGMPGGFAQQLTSRQLKAAWQLIDTARGIEAPASRLILSNVSKEPISCKGWSLWFNYMRDIDPASVDEGYAIEHRNGDLYQLSFLDSTRTIAAGDSLVIKFVTPGGIPNFTDAPSGLYLAYTQLGVPAVNLDPITVITYPSNAQMEGDLARQYRQNEYAEKAPEQWILPQPASIRKLAGTFTLQTGAGVYGDAIFDKEVADLTDFLAKYTGVVLKRNVPADSGSAAISFRHAATLDPEAYQLVIHPTNLSIVAGSAEGAFYAIQSLKSLLKASYWGKHADQVTFPCVEVDDKPRFGYRALMLDVSRNFHPKQSILRILDVMAMYKLNTLHLHLNDDEGWRLQIPELPELTEVGSVRDARYSELVSLQPAYGSGAVAAPGQFYTEADFVEILRYAADRHITVIPELETPGHARAAIRAMEARYQKYAAQGNMQEAERFLLTDFEDRSVYSSAQNWTDNVMNVALPSTYTFIGTVVDAIQTLYERAGLTLHTMHLGGDEVPAGAWEKSPKIREMMDREDIPTVHDVWPYYIEKISDLCRSKGIQLAGWEEMGMRNQGNGMVVNPAMASRKIQLDVWNNLIGEGQEDLAYKLANAGYPVVLTSASNFYLDLAWSNHFDEPGHNWAGYTSLRKSYSLLPENFFLDIHQYEGSERLPAVYFEAKERLTAEGRKNLIGLQAALWSEKIHQEERLEYMLFPRVFALAEKAWAPVRAWEKGLPPFDQEAFEVDFSAFMDKVGHDELKKMDVVDNGFAYRLPAIGVQIVDGYVHCNTEYPGFEIFYTEDGAMPTLDSQRYRTPIPVSESAVYTFRIITKQGRMGKVVRVTP